MVVVENVVVAGDVEATIAVVGRVVVVAPSSPGATAVTKSAIIAASVAAVRVVVMRSSRVSIAGAS